MQWAQTARKAMQAEGITRVQPAPATATNVASGAFAPPLQPDLNQQRSHIPAQGTTAHPDNPQESMPAAPAPGQRKRGTTTFVPPRKEEPSTGAAAVDLTADADAAAAETSAHARWKFNTGALLGTLHEQTTSAAQRKLQVLRSASCQCMLLLVLVCTSCRSSTAFSTHSGRPAEPRHVTLHQDIAAL